MRPIDQLSQWTLRKRIRVIWQAAVAIAVLVGVLTGWSRSQRASALQSYSDALAAERGLASVADCTARLQRELGLLASGLAPDEGAEEDASVTQGVTTALAACRARWSALPSMVSQEAVAQTATNIAHKLIDDWLFVVANLDRNPVAAMTRLAKDADPAAGNLVERLLPQLQQLAVAGMTDRVKRATAQAKYAEEVLAGILLLAGAALVLFLFWLGRRLERGLAEISSSAAAIGRGEFDQTVLISGHDEFAQVGKAMHQMGVQLAAANHELSAQATALRTSLDQLRLTQSALVTQEKMAALGQLVAGVAHEVNTPLGVALTSGTMVHEQVHALQVQVEAGAVTRGAVRRVVEDALEGLTLMVANLHRAAELIQSFKQVAVDRDQTSTRLSAVDAFFQELIQSLLPMFRHHGAALRLDTLCSDVVDVAAGELQQVLTNLVVNALVHAFPDATQQALLAQQLRPTVTIRAVRSTLQQSDRLVVVVQDNGCGMDGEVAKRALEPFFTTKRGQGSTGLGLHVAYSLVSERFSGDMELTTAPGLGTVWTLTLPIGTPALRLAPSQSIQELPA